MSENNENHEIIYRDDVTVELKQVQAMQMLFGPREFLQQVNNP